MGIRMLHSEAAQRDAVWSSLQEELRAAFPAMGSVDQQSATGAPAGSGAQPAASAHFSSQEWNNIQPVPGSQPGPQGFSGMGSGVFPVGTAPQAQQQPVQAPLARQQRQKGSFRYDPARAAAAVRLSPFDRSPVDIPPDLVTLFENGYHVPFCLLSLAGILQYHRGARTSFPTPLDSAAQRQLEAYLKIDRLYLRFEDWTASAMCFGVLVSHVCSSPSESAPDTNAEVQTWLEHAYTILSLQHGDNWPVLREYDFRVREAMATAMRDGSAMAFDIRSVNRPLLDMSAEMVQAKAKSFLDTEGALASELAKLLQAPASEHAAIVNVAVLKPWALPATIHFGPVASDGVPYVASTQTSTGGQVAKSPRREPTSSSKSLVPKPGSGTTSGRACASTTTATSNAPPRSLQLPPTVPPPPARSDITAPDAEAPTAPFTECAPYSPQRKRPLPEVPAARRNISVLDAYRAIVTPLVHEEWRIALAELPISLQQEYADIPDQI
ncbi:hypothetical protein A4X06_0g5737 [Tilletia controversa]|uniref:Uncharacterized protein n=1 Tax=Tilletia controversa TaxID=13291 RepID=A0A8X7MR73_9BASI|nr:hypothetical protein A4X06_0g5737 [Tilletia controversa]